MRIITDMFAWCAREMPNWNPISISGYHIREAGATAAQEIAFTLADGVAYVQAGVDAGLAVDDFAPRLSFFFNVHNNFFEEVAKFRAARRMWAQHHARPFRCEEGGQPAACVSTRRPPAARSPPSSPRTTSCAPPCRRWRRCWAAPSRSTPTAWTKHWDFPRERAVRIALRTQQVILEESGVADSIDPVGGSHYLEALTDALEERALALMAEIGKRGGMITAIEQGFPQREIERASYEYQKALERGDERVVGVNTANEGGVEDTPVFRVDPALEREQVARLEARRAARDGARVNKTLTALDAAARGTDNLMPLIMEAVAARATIGEICDTLAKTFGRHRDRGGMR